jgi:hypothetical protein
LPGQDAEKPVQPVTPRSRGQRHVARLRASLSYRVGRRAEALRWAQARRLWACLPKRSRRQAAGRGISLCFQGRIPRFSRNDPSAAEFTNLFQHPAGKQKKDTKNRGNKPRDLLKTKHLSSYGAKNKPKTNSILSAKSADQSEKHRIRLSGFRWRSPRRSRGAMQFSTGLYRREQEHLSTRFVNHDPGLSTSRL